MASKSQPGVILYFDDFRCELKYLSMEQRGKLFTAVLDYAEYGVTPEDGDLDPVGDCCFNRVAKKIDRNAQAYRETCEKRKKAIEKRWNDAGAYNSSSEDTSEYSCIQMNATETETETEEEAKKKTEKATETEPVNEAETVKEKKAAAVLGFDPFAITRNALYGERSVPSSPETDMETRKQEQIAAILGWGS